MHPVFISLGDILKMGKLQDFREKVGANQMVLQKKNILRDLSAEFIGTFLLVLIGCGSIVNEQATLVGVAFTFGITVASLAQALGSVSGCHINPAVTISMLVSGKINLIKSFLYILTQSAGAVVGSWILSVLLPIKEEMNKSEPLLGFTKLTNITSLQGFGIEFLLTFLLVLVIFAVTDENRNDIKGSAPLAIGLTVAALVIYGGPYTGASLNPARSLGPAVISGNWDDHWVYWLGPISGGIVAATLYSHIYRALRPDEIEAAELEKEKSGRDNEAYADTQHNKENV